VSAFDMSKTLRHPGVMQDRIESVLDSIAVLRGKLADREEELRQLLEISYEMWVGVGEQPQ
jgi:hypothetical protein